MSIIDIFPYDSINKNNDEELSMVGGKGIGEGGYGCVLKPGLTCKGKEMKTKKFITKIQVENSTSRREIEIGNMVKKIPLSKKYFAPIISSCDYKHKVVQMVSNKYNCSFFSKHPNKKFTIARLPYINGDDYKKYLHSNIDDNKFVYAFIHGYSYLLFSLYMLNKHGIIHYDIKGENIMYDKSRDIPIIIDFGLSIIKKDIKPKFNDPDYIDRLSNYFYVYAPDYSLWCLDIHYLCFIINHPNSDVKNEIENMVTIYMQNNKSFHHLSDEMYDAFKYLSIKQLNKYADMGTKESIKYILSYCDTWDNYSLSIMFMRVLNTLKVENSKFLQAFQMLLEINIHPDPKERLSLSKTHDKIINYLNNNINELNIFQNIINNINKNKAEIKENLKKQMRYDETVSHKMSILKSHR